MVTVGSDYKSSVRRVLELARAHLGMDVAYVSRFTTGGQVFEQVAEAAPGLGPVLLSEEPLEGSYCLRVLDGRLPPVIADARQDPRTRDLQVTEDLSIGSYIGVPILTVGGDVRGMLCCLGNNANGQLSDQDLSFMQSLAALVAQLYAMQAADPTREAELRRVWLRLNGAIAGRGMRIALQPIVRLATGSLYGVEALARFDEPPAGPDLWFADAARMGLRVRLEVAAIRAALARLDELAEGVVLSINVSPDVVVGAGLLDGLLADVDLSRVALEITEHAAVSDYLVLHQALAPFRTRGMRLSIDDAGAGYASFRHIVRLRPDSIKIDLSLIRDIDQDPVRQSLVTSFVAFAANTDVELIAEGVETDAELGMLMDLGVGCAQGYLLGRPVAEAPGLAAHL